MKNPISHSDFQELIVKIEGLIKEKLDNEELLYFILECLGAAMLIRSALLVKHTPEQLNEKLDFLKKEYKTLMIDLQTEFLQKFESIPTAKIKEKIDAVDEEN